MLHQRIAGLVLQFLKTGGADTQTMLIGAGFRLTMFREEEVNLESAFMALTKGVGAKI